MKTLQILKPGVGTIDAASAMLEHAQVMQLIRGSPAFPKGWDVQDPLGELQFGATEFEICSLIASHLKTGLHQEDTCDWQNNIIAEFDDCSCKHI